ncbi:DUF488 family protein [Candidatus Bathyarchaeota archaeon]|nr:MAG: DUF488 family protein [Candidatus Bathyarchaeota archaeon]
MFQIARCSRDRSRLDPIPGSRLTTIASKGILWRDRGSGFALSNIQIEKTVYDKRSTSDGKRILVMRLWPRGVRKESIDLWLKDVGTSRELIKDWKAGNVTRAQYEKRYNIDMKGELQRKLVKEIADYARAGPITLLCSCKDPNTCHRSLLKTLVEAEL